MNQVALFQEASAFTKFGSSEPGSKPSSQGNRFTSQPYTYSKYLKHTNTYDSSSSQPTSSYSKQLTDFKMMSSTLNYCLSSQVQMANALIEIGKYLKEHNESHSNATISTRAKPTILSTTPSSLSSNIRFQRVKEKPAIDLVLPSIMAKLEEMQSGILSKAQEYEKWQRNQYPSVAGHCSSTTLQPTTVSTNKENAKDSSQSKEPTQSKIIPSTQTKPLAYSPSRQKTDANAEGFLESISNIQLTHPDAPDDSSMFSKCDDLNIFESTITNHNVPATNYDMLKPSKNFERPSQKADIFTPLTHKDLATKDLNNTKQITTTITTNLVTNPQTTQANSVTNNSSKKIVVPPIKLKLGSNPAPLNSPGYKYSSYKAPEHQRHYSEVQSYRNTLGSESENIEFVGDHESKPLQGGTYKTERTARDSTKRLSYLSARELVPQESARLRLSTLPQKEVIDEGIESAQGDQTMQQIDISLLSIDEKPHQTPWMMYLNTDRSTENMKTPMEDALLIMAKKERETIRALMKEQYGPDASLSYHKAGHGKLYQKKYLINAKWWREWKDYVNFEVEDGDFTQRTKGSFLEAKTYPRPGPINNFELLRRDFIKDPSDLAPELELKENLLEHHDYEAVNKRIHNMLTTWYGSDFEICRLLRPDPFHNNKPYLDLYPRKKIGKRQMPKSMDANSGKKYAELIDKIITLNLKQPK